MENESPYKYQAAKLVEKIKKIITNSDMSSEKKSNEIMTALREEYILLPSSYINSFLYTREQVSIFNTLLLSLDWIKEDYLSVFMSEDILNKLNFSTHATISPIRVVGENYPGDLIKINGDSFGPFNPQEYFNPDNIRILWLLKEPLIKKDSWFLKRDRGGWNQAKDNRLWDEMEENDTLENLIEITQQTMSKISGKEYSQQDAMNKTCILEVNHFPGLYFKSWESDDAKLLEWAEINHNLISTLIDFYDPTIIYFASTLELFDTNIVNFEDVHKRFYNNDLKIFDDKICEWAYVYAIDGQEKDMPVKKYPITDKKQIKYVGRNIKYLGESGRIYVQAYHPAYKANSYTNPSKKDVLTKIDSDKVKEWLSSSVSPNRIGDMISKTSDHS